MTLSFLHGVTEEQFSAVTVDATGINNNAR